MSYSRRQLYALGEPIGDSATYKEGGRTIYGDGGGGGGSSAPTTSTTYSSNIPEYAKPYVETMLGSAQKQIYTMDDSGQATGFKPYVPYSTNPADYFAGFSPMQQQAFSTVANLQAPQQYGAATGLAGASAMGSLGLAGQMAGAGQQYAQQATNPAATQAYMSPYMQNVVDYQKAQAARDYQIQNQARKAQALGAGAFGGSRQAIVQSEADRALQSQLQGITATGAQQAFQNAQQQQQFGAQLGLQGQQAGLQGLGQALQSAQTLGQLGTSELGAQTQIAGLQQQYGAQQQALEQQKINQAIQNYATAQQYPYMQLGIINSLLRGLPMQSTTTQSYQATPSTAQQVAGLGLAGISGLGAYKAMSSMKEGGEVKGYASRGLAEVSRGVEGSVRAKLEMMSDQQLEQVKATSPSAEVRAMAAEVLTEHKIREQAEVQAQQAIAREQAAKPQIPQSAGLAAAPAPNMDTVNAASGGIVAFAGEDGSLVEEEDPYAALAGIKDKRVREAAERQVGLRQAFGVKGDPYKDYSSYLDKQIANIGAQKDLAASMLGVRTGLGIATKTGPWGYAAAESAAAALPDFVRDVSDIRKEQAGLHKGKADIAGKAQETALKAVEGTEKGYETDVQRATELERARIAANAQITAANRPTDMMQLYNTNLRALAAGDPAKMQDPAIQKQAMNAAAETIRGLPGQKLTLQGVTQLNAALNKVENSKEYVSVFRRMQNEDDATKKAQLQAQLDKMKNDVIESYAGAGVASGGNAVDFNALPKRKTS